MLDLMPEAAVSFLHSKPAFKAGVRTRRSNLERESCLHRDVRRRRRPAGVKCKED